MSPGDSVQAWAEQVVIPTYGVGEPNANPMFLEKRVYQGSSGVVYPYPVIDSVADVAQPHTWQAVFLENEYLKIMVLPALGGRVQMALDKTNDYHFVYYNRVIKPALVGLAGPWISGGIEFNWPQHHRPNTYGPVEWKIEQGPDGSCTVWCSEVDRMSGTKGMHGLTLRPGKAYLEIQVKLANRTNLPQTFLWWANPAVNVDENHQSIFPPDVHAVMDHGKRDSISFPIAKGEYYKVDYSPGTDISRYKNIPVPTSYMAFHSHYNFVGSYDHGRRAGLLHVCDHHISPGKKQWTWGCGDFGQAWDRQLTDSDGPYIELMCGVYTDNQPDFSWLMPGEEKAFTQYFMPYKGVGRIGNATIDATIGMELDGSLLTVRAYVTSAAPGARVTVTHDGEALFEQSFDGTPETFFETACQVHQTVILSRLRAAVVDAEGRELVAWLPEPPQDRAVPQPARPIGAPETLDSTESLYLAGKHLEQYRHATRDPEAYYEEALRRDPGDARNNTAMASFKIRHGQFAEAERYARTAIERLTRHNPNPYDGEAHYLLGVACEGQGKFAQAADAYHKSTWNAAWQAASGFAIARLLTRQGDFSAALERVQYSLQRNVNDHRDRHLEIVMLRLLGRDELAKQRIEAAIADDPFNFGVLWEQALQMHDPSACDRALRGDERNYLTLAADYGAAGLFDEAITVVSHYLDLTGTPDTPGPWYLRAWYFAQSGNETRAQEDLRRAGDFRPHHFFPNSLDELAALEYAVQASPNDARAPYYLGCLWYHLRQPEKAIEMWRCSLDRNSSYATAWRNLGLACFNKLRDADQAWTAYNKAFALDESDARVLYELDQLAKRLGHSSTDRLAKLEDHRSLVDQRDDLYIEYVTLLNLQGKHREALDAVLARRFHPWEGGEGKASGQFVLAITSLARSALGQGRWQEAIELLRQTERWPESLGEGKIAGIQENDSHYLLGLAHSLAGDSAEATEFFQRASQGRREPTAAMYYNDQPPEMIFYQGLACRQLGREDEATARFQKLVEYGKHHLADEPEIDFFAVSLPDFLVFEDSLARRNRIHCHFMMALGAAGLGNTAASESHFQKLARLDPSHVGACLYPRWHDQ